MRGKHVGIHINFEFVSRKENTGQELIPRKTPTKFLSATETRCKTSQDTISSFTKP